MKNLRIFQQGSKRPTSQVLQRNGLAEQLHSVYSGPPSTNFEAYKKAQEALKHLEDMTFTDAEIDAFLPKALKRSSGSPVSEG